MPPRRAARRPATTAATAMTLVVITGPCAGREFELRRDGESAIGRTKRGNAVWIKGDGAVSQSHATCRWCAKREAWTISDAGSSNGTEVDGKDVEEGGEGATLRDGSVIKLGTETTVVCRTRAADERGEAGTVGEEEDEENGNRENAVVVNEGGRGAVGDGGKASAAKTKSGKRDAYAFDLDEPKSVTKVAAARKRAKATTVTAKQAHESTTAASETAEVATKAESRAAAEVGFDVPTVHEYATAQLERLQAVIRADARASVEAFRADARGLLADLLQDIKA